MTVRPLPFRPPPSHDELLSSWIGRLAKANHCSAEELCGYLGLGQGRVPERINDLGQVDWVRLCSAVQRTRHEIAAMTLPDATHHAVRYVSLHCFQHCPGCAEQTPGLTLRHWRFAWSMTCETCGQALVAKYPVKGISGRLRARAVRGSEALRAAVANNDHRRLRRIDLTLHLMTVLGTGHLGSLTSKNEHERLLALAAVNVGTTHPLLGAAIILRGNDGAAQELRRVFPQHRRVIERIRAMTQDLDRRLPELCEIAHPTGHETYRSCRSNASESALQAARQAISELGHDANRHALLMRADTIWRRPDGDKS
ncbi:TniQ family protein [Roseovarius sp. CH_XMU1461]|uniref:TniQ family protein n=1 Tax=Roseovarius sp. CH_XMU1461 TaxID=3107777 RepID=UPI0030091374